MKNIKKVIALLLIFTMGLSLVACASPDTELYNALEKMQGVTAVETETEISFQIKGEGFDQSEQMMIDQLGASLNNLKFLLKQKSLSNEDQTQAKAEGELSIDLGGMLISAKIWADVDLDTGDMKSIIQLPAMLSGLMGPAADKRYLVYDIKEMMELEDEEVDMEEIMELQKELEPKIIKLAEEIEKEFKPDFKIINLKEEIEVDGEKTKVYELKLDDKTLKELVKEFVNTTLDSEGSKSFIMDYIDLAMKMVATGEFTEEEMAEMKDGIKDVEENLDKNVEKAKEEFNKFMTKIEDVQLLGEKGITIEYSIGKDGYIVEINGVIDLRLNLEEISKVMEAEEETKGILKLTINYNTKNKNINNKDLKVELPELTEENSIDLLEMIELQMKELEKQMELFGDIEGLEFEGIELP